jgi:hypothetical protein
MTRWQLTLALVLLTAACGGSAPPAEAPAAAPPATPAPADAAASPSATTTSDQPASDGWEGEGAAKSAAGASLDPKAAAPPAPAQPTETRTVEVIQKIIKDHRPAVRDCYEQARKDLPSLQGDMIIHLVLDPAGKVKTAELNQEHSTLKAPPVVDCALKVLKNVAFPSSSRGMETAVNYPFNFMPGGPPQR